MRGPEVRAGERKEGWHRKDRKEIKRKTEKEMGKKAGWDRWEEGYKGG